jgi:hypothetical protein
MQQRNDNNSISSAYSFLKFSDSIIRNVAMTENTRIYIYTSSLWPIKEKCKLSVKIRLSCTKTSLKNFKFQVLRITLELNTFAFFLLLRLCQSHDIARLCLRWSRRPYQGPIQAVKERVLLDLSCPSQTSQSVLWLLHQ